MFSRRGQPVPSIQSVINQAGASASPKVTSSVLSTPWTSDVNSKDSFFSPLEIQGDRWNKLYPYRILVVRPKSKNRNDPSGYEIVSSQNATDVAPTVSKSTDSFRVSFRPTTNLWEFNLPITPQQMSISNQFAISNSATLGGIVEEKNGTKFKMISMSGTFGIWPFRGNVDSKGADRPSSLQTLFGGSISAFSGLSRAISQVVSTATNTREQTSPETNAAFGSGFAGTGYAQALLLDQFLEQYSELSKLAANSDWRLALDIPKQNQTYLVTPVIFTYSQDASSPNEYRFNLQLKAYRRVSLESKAVSQNLAPRNPTDTNVLQTALNSISDLRRALASATNLVRAVRSDFLVPFNALRELSLFVKELSGLAISVAELPDNVVRDAKFLLAEAAANSNIAATNLDRFTLRSRPVSFSNASENKQSIDVFKKQMEGQPLNSSAVQNSLMAQTGPLDNIFNNPSQNFDFLNTLTVDRINFPFAIQQAIETETARVSLMTADDIRQRKDILKDLSYQISNSFGTGNEDFSRVYGKPKPKKRLQEITIDEYAILTVLYDTILVLGSLTVTDAVNSNQNAAFDFVRGEALDAGIQFEDSPSKIRAPVPFGLTMEQIANRYLGAQERWIEIATLNNLKSPYIDEVGTFRSFLSNGDGRQFNVSSNTNLFIGQNVFILSTTQPRQKRRIIDIERINDNNFLITVDGLDNLSIFTTAQNAQMLSYLPGTVNSQDQIFIPSDQPVPVDLATRPVPAAQDDELSGLSKIDFLLTDDNDIAIDTFGDFRLAFGLTNIMQALKIKFITEPGQLIRHTNFGSGLRPGASNADVSAQNVYNSISALIAQDPRYAGIESLEVILEGPILRVNLSVFIANGLGVFPISFQLAA